ncbi:hypothetical protein [Psychromonas sp. SP041]|uniref:hypothetical protein n=1 Tax=Psychromonas sp. SP041 TaxID=1365007 RepID=UPI00042A3217|nr:hypothetical protein [Psychromonas sp. SP041]
MKKLTLVALSLVPLFASASPVLNSCDYLGDSGREFTFLQSDPSLSFKNRMTENTYPFIVSDKFHGNKLNVAKYEYRHAKLNDKSFFRRTELSSNGVEEPVRYYNALVDNCDTVWFKVNESSGPAEKYMDSENDNVTGRVPWDRLEDELSIRFTDTFFKIKKHIGKFITAMPASSGEKLRGKSLDIQQWVDIDDFEKLKVLNVLASDFVYEGRRLGSTQIKVSNESGSEFYVPWNIEKLYLGNPFNKKEIRSKFYGDIKRGNIRFGMNYDEVTMTWGEPDFIKDLPLYKRSDHRMFVKDVSYPYGDVFTRYTVAEPIEGTIKGKFVEAHYLNRLRAGESLKFDTNGVLLEDNQVNNLHKNEVNTPLALPLK